MDHADEGIWSDSGSDDYPVVLLFCETDRLYKRLKWHIHRQLEDIWVDDLVFGLTTKKALLHSTDKKDKIWLPVTDKIGTLTVMGRLKPEYDN